MVVSLNNNKCILVYGLTNEELVECAKRKIKTVVIRPDMASMKIADICKGLKFSTFDDLMPKEKAVLFNNYEDKDLNKAIKEVRGFVSGGILAVVTPTSSEWTFKYLLTHLIEEREWFKTHS